MHPGKKYTGIIAPAVTPLTTSYQLDEAAVEKLFTQFYENGISPYILGTAGEGPSLPQDARLNYLITAARCKKPGSVLYADISFEDVNQSIDFARLCAAHNVDVVVASLPLAAAQTESAMRSYFEELAQVVPLPIIIDNTPATIKTSIPLTVVDELSMHENIVAIKDSEQNEERLMKSLELWKDRRDFGHILEWEAKSALGLIAGSDGLMPATANLCPQVYATLWSAFRNNDFKQLYAMQQLSDRYGKLYQANQGQNEQITTLKVLLQELGICQSVVLPPLQPLGADAAATLLQAFSDLANEKKETLA